METTQRRRRRACVAIRQRARASSVCAVVSQQSVAAVIVVVAACPKVASDNDKQPKQPRLSSARGSELRPGLSRLALTGSLRQT